MRNWQNAKYKFAATGQSEAQDRQKRAEQKEYAERLTLGRAQVEILAPAIRAMRELGLDNKQISSILEKATQVLQEHRPLHRPNGDTAAHGRLA